MICVRHRQNGGGPATHGVFCFMSVRSLLISGPRYSGKTTLSELLAELVLDLPAHYLRLHPASDAHTNAVIADALAHGENGERLWASRHRVSYTLDRLFETIPDGLRLVRKLDRLGLAVIEADADPALRHAFPYDFRVFVMSAPADIYTVFRTPDAAGAALQQVLQDTAAFASEIFGLFEDEAFDDSLGVEHYRDTHGHSTGQKVEKLNIAEAQIRQFLNSPLGAEIASRIQLQPEYHALVEADVVIVNTGWLDRDYREVLDECVARLQKLLTRIRQDARRQSVLYWGDIREDDNARRKLMQRIRALLANDA
jgi:hypothetical protein